MIGAGRSVILTRHAGMIAESLERAAPQAVFLGLYVHACISYTHKGLHNKC